MTWSINPTATFGFFGGPKPYFQDFAVHRQFPLIDEATADAFPPVTESGCLILPETYQAGPYWCQLAQEEGARPWPEWGAIVDEKIDGIRAIWLGHGAPKTREGNEIECAWWTSGVLPILAERLGPGEWMIDAELTVGDSIESTLAAFKRGGHATDAILHVFDAIPLAEWESGKPGDPLHERKRRLRAAFAQGPIMGMRLVRSWECADPAYVDGIATRIWQEGGEGVVVKDRRAPYARSRTRAWWKLKRRATYSVEITGWIPKRYKPGDEPKDGEPRLGALTGLFRGRKVKIAAGFDDTARLKWARLADALPGRIAEVDAMELTLNGSLRHPRFIRWRHEGEGQ
jgi:DNA ligase-1